MHNLLFNILGQWHIWNDTLSIVKVFNICVKLTDDKTSITFAIKMEHIVDVPFEVKFISYIEMEI